MYMYMYIYMYVCMYVCMYIYIYIYIYIYMRMPSARSDHPFPDLVSSLVRELSNTGIIFIFWISYMKWYAMNSLNSTLKG
jgi:hypothetical protein